MKPDAATTRRIALISEYLAKDTRQVLLHELGSPSVDLRRLPESVRVGIEKVVRVVEQRIGSDLQVTEKVTSHVTLVPRLQLLEELLSFICMSRLEES